ncbi:RNA polymerase sigma factor [Puia sp. P3]|uniref:RNA polymerase sigma factor n=1 Tax=Puia sp. P3 TaxID=3423952 RepID=UPI003D67EE51
MGVKKIQITDRYELEALFRKHYHFLCTAAYYITGDESTAKDIVQEFFYYCWKKREEIIIAGEFKSYASRAVRNACLNYLKSSRRTSLRSEFVYNSEPSAGEPVQEEEEGLEERNKALWAAIDRLPEQRRLIFLLCNKDELTLCGDRPKAGYFGQYSEDADPAGVSVPAREECRWLVYFYFPFL